MKTKMTLVTLSLIFVVLSFFQISCKTAEKSAIACPELSIKNHNKFSGSHRRFKAKVLIAHNLNNRSQTPGKRVKNQEKIIKNPKYSSGVSIPFETTSNPDKIDYSKGLIASTNNIIYPTDKIVTSLHLMKMSAFKISEDSFYSQPAKCDTIVLKSGALLIGKVEEIGQTEIKYRKCDNLSGPMISIPRPGVSAIHYSNGTNDLFGPSETYFPNQYNSANNNSVLYNNSVLKTEGLGLAGFVSGLLGLFVASIPLGLIAVIFGSISLSRIKRYPQRFKGRGFAIASIILGLVDVIVMIALLASM